MENRRYEENLADIGPYLTEKEQQYSRELSEVRSHLEDRVKEVKTDLKEDIKDIKADLKADIQTVRDDLKERISGLRAFIGITVTIAAIIIPLIVKALSS